MTWNIAFQALILAITKWIAKPAFILEKLPKAKKYYGLKSPAGI
jgi:hypothetical protein